MAVPQVRPRMPHLEDKTVFQRVMPILTSLGLAVALSATGCVDFGDSPSPVASRSEAGPAKPKNQPYDIYLGDDLGSIDYARLVLAADCLAKKGFPQLKRAGLAPRKRSFPDLLITPSSFGYTSEQEARARGFGRDLPAEPSRVWSKDPNFELASKRCDDDAWAKLGSGSKKVYDQYFELGNALLADLVGLHRASIPQPMALKIANCMEIEGYRLSDKAAWSQSPNIKSFGVAFGSLAEPSEATWVPTGKGIVEVGPPIPARKYTPTAEESRLAVAWHRCSVKEGWAEHQMRVAMERQQAAVKKHEAQFTELNPKIQQLAKQAAILAGQS